MAMDPTDADGASSTASEAARFRALLKERRFSELLLAGQARLAQKPDERDALLFAAIARRYLGRVGEALATLETLERHHPRFSRLHEERGRCFVEMKQAPQAIEAFARAVSLNHSLPGSWSMLEGLYRLTGQTDDGAVASAQAATLRKIPAEVVTATGLFLDGDLEAAEPMVRAYLLKHGDQVEAMRLLARFGIARKVFDDAELLLAAVLELAPEYRAARREYAEVLIELHKYPQARGELSRLLEEEPESRLGYQSLIRHDCRGTRRA